MKLKVTSIALCVSLLSGFGWAAPPPVKPLNYRPSVIQISPNSDETVLLSHTKAGDPLRADAFLFLAIKTHSTEQMGNARNYLEQALAHCQESQNPKFIQMVSLAGLGLMDIEEDSNYTLGKQKIEQSLSLIDDVEPRLKPTIAELYASYSEALYATGHLSDANRMLKKAFVLDPNCDGCKQTLNDLKKADVRPDYFHTQFKDLMRWNDETHTVTVFLDTGVGLKDWNPNNLNLAKQDLQKWEIASNQRFQFQLVSDPSLADVRFKWIEPFIPSTDGSAIGMSIPEMIDSNLVKNDVVICLHDDMGKKLSQDEIDSTILHELGHMLGIQGHSPNWADVMASESVTNIISERDIVTLNRIYALKPTFTNPLGLSLAQCRLQTFSVDDAAIKIPIKPIHN